MKLEKMSSYKILFVYDHDPELQGNSFFEGGINT